MAIAPKIDSVLNNQQNADAEPNDGKNPYEDKDAISATITDALRVDSFSRYTFESDWFRNCLIGKELVPLLDGRKVPISELAGQNNIWLYGFDLQALRIVPVQMEACWSNGEKECVEVVLDNGHSFTCTVDHRVLTWFGYEEAGKLKPDTPLVPFRDKFYRARGQGDSYSQIFQPYDAEWEQTHRVVAEAIYGHLGKNVVHHKNEIKTDNRPENLEPMDRGDHSLLTLQKHKAKIVKATTEYARRPEERERRRQQAKRQWADNYDHMLKVNREFRSRPEYIEKLRNKVSAFWSDPEKRAARIAQMKEHWEKRREQVNCRVVEVRPAGTHEVFDMSVPATQNFALASGVFVHNCLFLVGAQWIKKQNGRWVNRNLPIWFPRSQTNKFAEKAKDLVGQLVTGQKIPITFWPATGEEADIGAAKVAERVRDVYYTEANVEGKEEEIASWVVVTGNAFGIPSYDTDKQYGMVFTQFQSCTQCGTILKPEDLADQADEDEPHCPECGGELEAANDEDGNPMGDEYPRGAINLDVASGFEIRGDHRVRNVSDWTWFIQQKRYDVEFAKSKWPEYKDHIEPDEGGDDPGQFYLDVIANLTSGFTVGAGLVSSGNPNSKQPKCTAYKMYKLPCEKYPQGLQAIRIGKNPMAVVEAGPLTTEFGAGVKKGQKFLPLIHWGYELVPGRFWRKTPLDDVVPLQLFRNTVEANIRLTWQRMGNPVWLLPKGCGVDTLTGEPGQAIQYNPFAVGGTQLAKPERVQSELSNIAGGLATLKEIDDAIEHVSGATLQGGQTPPGVTAASALAYLGEKEQQALSTLRSSYAKSWRQFDEYALELARQNWDDERLRVIAGKNNKWNVEKFTKADLQGAVNLIIDYNGIAPKSTATEQAKVGQLVQFGAVNPTDPSVRIAIFKKFGAMDLLGDTNTDIEYAAKVADKFMDDHELPNFRPGVDNSQVLLREAIELAKTDEFLELPPDAQNTWTAGWCQLLMQDIAQRRVTLTAAGLDPDVPALEEIPSALAKVGLVAGAQEQQQLQAAAMAQSQGQPQGQQAPDPRLDQNGAPLPASGLPGAPPSPDIGDTMNVSGQLPPAITPPGAPRRIDIPQNG